MLPYCLEFKTEVNNDLSKMEMLLTVMHACGFQFLLRCLNWPKANITKNFQLGLGQNVYIPDKIFIPCHFFNIYSRELKN